MKKNIYSYYVILLGLFFCFFSCTSEQNQKQQKKNSFIQPLTISASSPNVKLLDTCIKLLVIELPAKGSKVYTVATASGPEKLTSNPPISTPIKDGEDGGFSIMQKYSTEQGLALSSVNCGYKDRAGNLWFGTSGGGVSKYDGKSFTNYTTAHGLASNLIMCIMEDRAGNIWFGTSGGGVSKYDGKYFSNFTTAHGLAHNRVPSMAEDKSGNLWFCTDGGISKYHPVKKEIPDKSITALQGRFTNFTISHGLISNSVESCIIDSRGYLWFGTGKGISRYNPSNKSFTNYTTAQGLKKNKILDIMEDKIGNIWFATAGGGVSRYDPNLQDEPHVKCFTNYNAEHGLPGDIVYCITEDKAGNIWFGTDQGLSKFAPTLKSETDVKQFKNFTTAQGLSSNAIRCIVEDKTGALWIGTNTGGLNKYEGNSLTSFTKNEGLVDNKVWNIMEDQKENLWFAAAGGISKFDWKSFTNFEIGMLMASVRCITEDKNGNIWFGSNMGAIKFDGKSFTNYTLGQELTRNAVLNITEDKTGNLWFGTFGDGIIRYDGNRIEALRKGENTSTKNQRDLQKRNGKFVSSFTNFTTKQGLVGNTIKCVLEDRKGNIWLGTNGNGVSKYDAKESSSSHPHGTFTTYTVAQGLPHNSILSIKEDKNGNIWFGTAGGGASKYNPSALDSVGSTPFTTYSSAQGLANDVVYAIVEDTLNNTMWFGTNLGLSALKLNSLSLAADEVKFEHFNNNTGYPIKDLNTSALFLDKKNILWAGTNEKLFRFDYKSIHKSAEPPAVFIQAVKINGENIAWNSLKTGESDKINTLVADSLTALNEEVTTFGRALTEIQLLAMRKKFSDIEFDEISPFYPLPENLVLPFENNNVTFDFLAIETARPFMVNYQYILDGYDKEWSPITTKTTATFGNIREGSYLFKLKAQSPDGIWSEPVRYSFKVLPPLQRTWWAYSIYLITGFLLIWLSIRWRERNFIKEKIILEAQVDLRTKQLAEKNQIVEEKNKVVEEQKKEVIEKNIKITDSINYAKRIQHAILPSQELIKSFLPNSFIFYRPKDIVSGDFYWFSEKKDRLLIAVADCTGHGVPGAFMSMIGNTLLNEIVNVKNICEPDQILNQMNKGIVNLLHQGFTESETQDDGMDISILAIDKTTRELTYAGANHFAYLFNHNKIETLKGDVFSIGGMFGKAEIKFSGQKIKIDAGCTLYLFTDGFADQFGGEKNTKFLSGKLEQLLQNIQQYNMEQQKNLLVAAFDDWKGKQNQTDDILIVGIRL